MAESTGTDGTKEFEQERSRLFGLAYRMMGSVSDAEDIVQEAWLRFDATEDIRDSAAFLTTVTSRLAIDRLRSAQHRRETYVGPWISEPVLTNHVSTEQSDPAELLELDETVTLGFLRVLDTLTPTDRAVFLLHDVFGTDYAAIAEMIDKTEANCRQIAKRARQRVTENRPRHPLSAQQQEQLLTEFTTALFTGDTEGLAAALANDVVFISDGGAERRAARQPIVGPERVIMFLLNLVNRRPSGSEFLPIEINGQPAVAVVVDNEVELITEVEFDDGRISQFHAVLNPAKLESVRSAWEHRPL